MLIFLLYHVKKTSVSKMLTFHELKIASLAFSLTASLFFKRNKDEDVGTCVIYIMFQIKLVT